MIELVKFVIAHSGEIWAQILVAIVALGAFLKGVEGVISLIAPYTPWKWDNDLAELLGKFVANKIFQKK